jgi:hypothetical protein
MDLIEVIKEGKAKEINLQKADLQNANLERANLREANLQWANLQGANLQETNLLGTKLALYQAAPQASILGLGKFLQNHVNSDLFDQSQWSFEYGGAGCLASAAAQFVGAAGNSGVGVLAIKKAFPNFNLEVLYQKDPQLVITELNKFAL